MTFDPRRNDFDPEGAPLSITAVSTPAHGAATLNGGTSVTYTPSAGYAGPDSFSYNLSDGQGGTASATVLVITTQVGRVFAISPSVNGKLIWNLDVDGPLILDRPGVWAVTAQSTFTAPTKAWGAAGGLACCSTSGPGAGGHARAYIRFDAGASYRFYVGGGGAYGPKGANGGLNGGGNSGDNSYTWSGAGGGGYSGVRTAAGTGVLIAGGGGGQGWGGSGGGGGVTAEKGGDYLPAIGGAGGGGAAYQGGDGATYIGRLGGGGCGGYLGGAGGAVIQAQTTGGAGGGGGTGYLNPSVTIDGLLVSAIAQTPGGAADPARGDAGSPNSTAAAVPPGRLVLGGAGF